MRIVHDIESKATAIVGGGPYGKRVDAEKSSGIRTQVSIHIEEDSDKFVIAEDIHIHGNAKYILAALEDAAHQLRVLGKVCVEDGSVVENWTYIDGKPNPSVEDMMLKTIADMRKEVHCDELKFAADWLENYWKLSESE